MTSSCLRHSHDFDCRNNRLAQLGLAQDGFIAAVATACGAIRRGSDRRIHRHQHVGHPADRARLSPARPGDRRAAGRFQLCDHAEYVLRVRISCGGRCNCAGPAAAVSSACSSSAKVFGSAARMIEAGLIDAAVVGGVDSLCLTTLYGFSSLQLTSTRPCRPFDRDRDGISIGEGGGVLPARTRACRRRRRTPSCCSASASRAMPITCRRRIPEGLGARIAMEQALAGAALAPDAIDYINLHGTGTRSNDPAEGRAVLALFGAATPCSSTKGAVGHTLGAAGGVEAVISALALRHGFMPAGVNTRNVDPALPLAYLLHDDGAGTVAGAQQFIRLRRHQLQPHLRPRGLRRSAVHECRAWPRTSTASASSAPACRIGRVGRPCWPATNPYVARARSSCRRRQRCRRPNVAASARGEAGAGRGLRGRRRGRGRIRRASRPCSPRPARRRELPRNLPDARVRRPADLADALPQLGAQRAGRLLEHRHRCDAIRRRRSARSTAASAPDCSKPPARFWSRAIRCCSSPTIPVIRSRCIESRPIADAFGMALLLSPERTEASLGRIANGAHDGCRRPSWRTRRSNPCAPGTRRRGHCRCSCCSPAGERNARCSTISITAASPSTVTPCH